MPVNTQWFGELASAPVAPNASGDEYFDTTLGYVRKFIGGEWVQLTSGGTALRGTSISNLPNEVTPTSANLLPIVVSGANKRVSLENLVKGLPAATLAANGVLSAADKTSLDALVAAVAALEAAPTVQTVASAATVTINAGTSVLVLTGTVNVTTVNTPAAYKVYVVHYPAGAGLTFLGVPLSVGQAILIIGTP